MLVPAAVRRRAAAPSTSAGPAGHALGRRDRAGRSQLVEQSGLGGLLGGLQNAALRWGGEEPLDGRVEPPGVEVGKELRQRGARNAGDAVARAVQAERNRVPRDRQRLDGEPEGGVGEGAGDVVARWRTLERERERALDDVVDEHQLAVGEQRLNRRPREGPCFGEVVLRVPRRSAPHRETRGPTVFVEIGSEGAPVHVPTGADVRGAHTRSYGARKMAPGVTRVHGGGARQAARGGECHRRAQLSAFAVLAPELEATAARAQEQAGRGRAVE